MGSPIDSEREPIPIWRKGLAFMGVAGSVVFLLNLTLGVVEIPDNLPLVGNMDEAAAAALLFSCLRYLGWDVLPFRRNARKTNEPDG